MGTSRGGVGEIRPLGAATDPGLAVAGAQRTDPHGAGARPVAATATVQAELQRQRHLAVRAAARPELLDQPPQALAPAGGLRPRADEAATEVQRERGAVLAQRAHRAGADGEQPAAAARGADLGVHLHLVGLRAGPRHGGGGGHRPLAEGVQLHVGHAADVPGCALQRLRREVLGEEVVGQSRQDVHRWLIVARSQPVARTETGPTSAPAVSGRVVRGDRAGLSLQAQSVERSPPGTHSTSPRSRFAWRARMKTRSESRFR